MPPKKNAAGKAQKSSTPAKGKGKAVAQKKMSPMNLRKIPKRKSLSSEEEASAKKQVTRKKRAEPAKVRPTVNNSDSEFDGVAIMPRDSDDNFGGSDPEIDEGNFENSSSNATPEDSGRKGSVSADPKAVSANITEQVTAAVAQYFRHRKSKKKGKKKKSKRARTEYTSSDSDSSGSETTSSSEETSDESDSDSGKGSKRRRRKRKKSKKKKAKKGETSTHTVTSDSPSVSTVYTRGCKSPQNAIISGSSSESLDGGEISSNADTDDFINSMNTSINSQDSGAGHRRSRSRSPARHDDRNRGMGDRREDRRTTENDPQDERHREQADAVIRDLHQNKAELAKPSGESEQFMASLLRDFKHFHLTSHVDPKVRERIKGKDFTVDFRRLLPRSRARAKYDDRLQVVHQEGSTYFVPAGERDVRDINTYKTWEVAFKIFMGIYNESWPERMQELLQYSHVIQTASLTHPWENVYNYDIAFREIMTGQPNTHWGVISQQTWSLELGEPSSKIGVNQLSQPQTTKVTGSQKNPCWKFNKGKCTFGDKCEYDHRCAHCGKRGHGRHECFRRQKGEPIKETRKERTSKN